MTHPSVHMFRNVGHVTHFVFEDGKIDYRGRVTDLDVQKTDIINTTCISFLDIS